MSLTQRLHQLIAAEKDVRRINESVLTNAHQRFQQAALFQGLSKVYRPADEEGQPLPSERQLIRASVPKTLAEVGVALVGLIDLTATKDDANRRAEADIVIDGDTIAAKVSIPTLLWLEKKLAELRNVLVAIPVLSAEEQWTWDAGAGYWRTDERLTLRQVDVPEFRTVSPATDKHPAQVVQLKSNRVEGTWSTTVHSAAVPAVQRQDLLTRVDALIVATKVARERANAIEVEPARIGNGIVAYLFQ